MHVVGLPLEVRLVAYINIQDVKNLSGWEMPGSGPLAPFRVVQRYRLPSKTIYHIQTYSFSLLNPKRHG